VKIPENYGFFTLCRSEDYFRVADHMHREMRVYQYRMCEPKRIARQAVVPSEGYRGSSELGERLGL